MAKTPSETFDNDELLALARLALEKNDFEGALLKLKKLIADDNCAPEAIALAARIYAQLRLFERAEQLYQRYLTAHPKALLERFQLGMTRFDAGKMSEALDVWNEVLHEQPAHPPALFYKGLALAQSGKKKEAKQVLDSILRSVASDNLYFGRAKELLQALETEAGATRGLAESSAVAQATPRDPYRTEH